MARAQKKRTIKVGAPPGTLVHVGSTRTDEVKISVMEYRDDFFREEETVSLDACIPLKDSDNIKWINVEGIHQPATLEKLGQCYGFHPLVLEDIMATDQRPKLEDFGEYLFIVLKMISYNGKNGGLEIEQVSLILGKNYLISFQEGKEGDVFNPLRERIRAGKGRVRSMGADYLAYALIDSIVDNYYLAIDKLGDEIEAVEERLVNYPVPETLRKIHKLRKDMIYLRKSVWPLREVVSGLERLESPLFAKSTAIYLKDVYDHTIRVIETIETDRDMLSVILDVYLSSINNRLNAVMKVLTVIATIFMPLTFIAGVYGMNFKFIPGLEWEWSFAVFILAMIIIAGGMLLLFWRKKWL